MDGRGICLTHRINQTLWMASLSEGDHHAINATELEHTVKEPQSTSTTCIKPKPSAYPIYVALSHFATVVRHKQHQHDVSV